jgi:hypothetical protein
VTRLRECGNASMATRHAKDRAKPQQSPHLELVDLTGPEITSPHYSRISPGVYPAYCKWAKTYRDPGFRRWTCLLMFDVLLDDLLRVLARVPMWLNLGDGEKPHAGRRTRYFTEYVRAGGMARPDRMSPRVFMGRMATVEIADTNSPAPYSVVREIISWDTGTSCLSGSGSQQVTQSREASPKP